VKIIERHVNEARDAAARAGDGGGGSIPPPVLGKVVRFDYTADAWAM
jgi:hypothetical protein